jgi:DnaJ-class molecular chaperone
MDKSQKPHLNKTDVVGSFFVETVACVRCNGKGSANPFTYPDQAHYKGCRLCKGTGKNKVQVYPSGRML